MTATDLMNDLATASAPAEFDGWEREDLRAELVAHGLYVDTGVDGVVGHGPVFMNLLRAFDDAVTRAAADEVTEQMSFPPVLPRRLLEIGGYLGSFPHLTGSVWSFEGTEAQAREQGELAASGGDWSGFQSMTDLALTPAACHPVYPAVAARGRLPEGGLTIDTGLSNVFRHEPSRDPARLQSFRMRELVRLGSPESVLAWRDHWRDRSHDLLARLGLSVEAEEASDPFFGRVGRVLRASQLSQALKFELLVPVTNPVRTAVASFNAHREHFSEIYGLELADGSAAHTACLGFGMERVALALVVRHGFEPRSWPPEVRAELWP